MGEDHYDHLLCPGLQSGPPSQTPGGLGQRYWSVSVVTWPRKSGVSEAGVFRAFQLNDLRSLWPNSSTHLPEMVKTRKVDTGASVWVYMYVIICSNSGIILCMRLANERGHYSVTLSLIVGVNTQNDPSYVTACMHYCEIFIHVNVASSS